MLKVLLSVSLLLASSPMFSQIISFESSKVLFDHPGSTNSGLSNPFIPLDYNDDGITDFIGATFNDQFLYKGLDNSNFNQLVIHPGYNDNPLKVMDFDIDGDHDIIMEGHIKLYDKDDNYVILKPNINYDETIIEAADFNNDGLTDILIQIKIPFENDQVIIRFNLGNNQFGQPIVIHNKYDYTDISVGDIDNDGDIDIAAILEFEDIPIVILFNQNGTFTERELKHKFEISRTTIKLHDLDGDNDLDIITSGIFDDIILLQNVNNYTNENTVIKIKQFDIIYFNISDLNNDNKIDIVTLTSSTQGFNINFIEGKGGFDFKTPVKIETFKGSDFFGYPNFNYVVNNLSLYDLDSDGKTDIIYTDGFGTPNQVKWLKNKSTTVSSNEILPSESFFVFPNPSQNYLEIKSVSEKVGDMDYRITSACGKNFFIKKSNHQKIDISDLVPGVYFITSTELATSLRFVKI